MTSLDYYYKFKSVCRIEVLQEFLDQLNELQLEDESIINLIEDKIESENNYLFSLQEIPENESSECQICMDNECYLDEVKCKNCKYNYLCDTCFKTLDKCPYCRTSFK